VSWDIVIMDLPRSARETADIPRDFKPGPLGQRRDLIAAIRAAAPAADFTDPSWGLIDGTGFSIEVNIGTAEQVDSIMLHVRGGDAAIAVITAILDRLNARALDMQTGEPFDETTAARSLSAWRAYRDHVAGPPA
jgi:hypothetical protein